MNKKRPENPKFILDVSNINIKNAVIKTLLQGRPCSRSLEACSYYEDGLKCVIGHMMTDEKAQELQNYVIENGLVGNIGALVRGGHVELVPNNVDLDQIIELQDVHDYWAMRGTYIPKEGLPYEKMNNWRKAFNLHLNYLGIQSVYFHQICKSSIFEKKNTERYERYGKTSLY